MEPKNVFLFLSLLPILFGVFILIAAIKNWGKNMTPRKLVYKIIREALGEKGTRIFGGLAGIGSARLEGCHRLKIFNKISDE